MRTVGLQATDLSFKLKQGQSRENKGNAKNDAVGTLNGVGQRAMIPRGFV